MPQYMLKLPQGANTDTQMANGTQPNQDFRNIFTKIKNPNPFLKNPQFWEPYLIFYIIYDKKKGKMF